MAFSMNTGSQRGRRARYRPLAEINVTPLVDVMLVLLIIFMVTAPLMTSGVSVDLPKTDAQPLNSDSEPLTVSIKADGSIFLQDQPIALSDLVARLQAIAQNKPDRRIFVRGDKDLPYGRIMEVMGTITQGGFTKVALLAEQPLAQPAPSAQGSTNQGPTNQGPTNQGPTNQGSASQGSSGQGPAAQTSASPPSATRTAPAAGPHR